MFFNTKVIISISITGHVSFLSKIIANRITVSGNLLVTKLNDMDVVAAARDLVLNGQDATITSPAGLQFTAPLKGTVFHACRFTWPFFSLTYDLPSDLIPK